MLRKIGIYILFLFWTGGVWAHPPRNIDISYDSDSKELTVFITHFTNNPLNHYIEYIAVYDGDEIIVSRFFTGQASKEGQLLKINLNGKEPGNNLVVKCRCNKFGKKGKNMTLLTERKE
jgi:desulfoferrodoxin (superoxide reductase-like protein)